MMTVSVRSRDLGILIHELYNQASETKGIM